MRATNNALCLRTPPCCEAQPRCSQPISPNGVRLCGKGRIKPFERLRCERTDLVPIPRRIWDSVIDMRRDAIYSLRLNGAWAFRSPKNSEELLQESVLL